MPQLPQTAEQYANWRHHCRCGREHQVPTRKVLLGPDALKQLPQALAELNLGQRYWLLADKNTYHAAGRRVEELLSAAALQSKTTILSGDEEGLVHADDVTLEQARRDIWGQADCFIGVGSGVINDIAKLLAGQTGRNYVSVVTAASMNGYGSPFGVVLSDGVKETVPAGKTDLILADIDVIAAAPLQMTQAGFGDLLAKNSSSADWFMAGQVTGSYHCPVPGRMVRDAGEKCLAEAARLRNGDPQAVAVLTDALIIGGFAMTAAGVTAPASGAEHLVSHYVDMYAHLHHRRAALHGHQVALGTLIAAALYQHLLNFDPDDINVDKLVTRHREWPEYKPLLQQFHGEMAPLVIKAAEAKHLTKQQYRQRLIRIKETWRGVFSKLAGELMTVEQVRQAYRSAGTPTTIAQIDAEAKIVHRAVAHGRDIRTRYTAFDLAWEIGLLPDIADQIIDAAGV